jgi:conjugative transfer region protein (TIGR03748 family)
MKNISSFCIVFIITVIVSPYAIATANNTTEIGRYITVSNKPKESQVDLLLQTIQVRFPQNVQTVGDAMNYMLRLSGYSLLPVGRMSSALKSTLAKPLPAIDRDFGPMSLKEGLTTLAGPAFYLVQDPLNRMVDFRVKSQYIAIYKF